MPPSNPPKLFVIRSTFCSFKTIWSCTAVPKSLDASIPLPTSTALTLCTDIIDEASFASSFLSK